jgi:hypothetical protein
MKRILISLMMAGGLAMLAAPYANAAAIGECGKTYAILLNGAQPSTNRATGGSGEPGALTVANGVGSITFNAAGTNGPTGCTVKSGELIFNSGDVQTSPQGLYIGPSACYQAVSALGTGLPCFDGGNHMSGTIAPSANAGNSVQLSILADYVWVDGSTMTSAVPFGFTLQNNTGSTIGTGTSNPTGATNPTGQVLTIELQKIGATTNSTPAVPTVFGTAPYLGDTTISCQAWGANDNDAIAALNDAAPAISGAYQSTIGALQIFNAAQAGGSLSFNGNDNIGSTATPPSNNDCSFTDVPGNACSIALGMSCGTVPAAYGFADGTSNSIAFVGQTGNNCGDANVAGAGYATSAVVYGTTYLANYITVTGLFSAATGFVPPGGESVCQGFSSAPAGTISILTSPPTQVDTGPTYPQTKSTPIKITSTSPADCDIETTLTPVSGTHALCSASLVGTSGLDVNGGTISSTATVACTCTGKATAETDTYTVSYASTSCPIHSGTPITFTCKN